MATVALGLFNLPPELVCKIFEYLPGKDLKGMALCGSAAFKITAPILYRTIRLFYKEDETDFLSRSDKNPERMTIELCTDDVRDLQQSKLALGHATRVRIQRKILGWMDSDSKYFYEVKMSAATDGEMRSIFEQFDEGQLDRVKIDYETSITTLIDICSRQKNIRDLYLGDLTLRGVTPDIELLDSTRALHFPKLESLEISMIDDGARPLVLLILHQNSSTLRRMTIGGRTHARHLRRLAYKVNRMKIPPLPFNTIHFPSLEQLFIMYSCTDLQSMILWEAFKDMASVGGNLKRIRLSGFTMPYAFIQKLLPTSEATSRIESLQMSNSEYHWQQLEADKATGSLIPLPQMSSLSTLHMDFCTKMDTEFQAAYTSRRTLKRLWLQCPFRSNPVNDPIISELWDSSSLPLDHDRWPLLEELALQVPQRRGATIRFATIWKKIPMLKSLKILRLIFCEEHFDGGIDWDPFEAPPPIPYENNINVYTNQLYNWSTTNYGEPPNLRLMIVDTQSRYTPAGEYRAISHYFSIYPSEIPGVTLDEQAGVVSPPVVKRIDEPTARSICKQAGCYTYLIDIAAWSKPDRFWEDDIEPCDFGY
ncbi:hypothetical protein TWF281_000743 [Arthrobotrys megalospora]